MTNVVTHIATLNETSALANYLRMSPKQIADKLQDMDPDDLGNLIDVLLDIYNTRTDTGAIEYRLVTVSTGPQ